MRRIPYLNPRGAQPCGVCAPFHAHTMTTQFNNPFFYQPGTPARLPVFIDQAVAQPDGTLIGRYSHESIDQLRLRYPGVAVGEMDAIVAEREERLIGEPSEISSEQFHEALEVLPPNDYCENTIGVSFKMAEHLSGDITQVLACVHGRYFAFNDRSTMSHAAIMAKVSKHIEDEDARLETPTLAS